MTLKSYGDCVVIRWCENYDEQRKSIRGINGHAVSTEQLEAMSFSTQSEPYVRNMHRLRAVKADRQDLAMLCFLCVLTGDRWGILWLFDQQHYPFNSKRRCHDPAATRSRVQNSRELGTITGRQVQVQQSTQPLCQADRSGHWISLRKNEFKTIKLGFKTS